MPGWAVWLLLAVVFAAAELFTPGLFVLGLLVAPAAAAALVAAVGVGVEVQLLVFIVGSVAMLALLRPIARRHVRMPGRLRTGAAALVGARAVVLERVDDNGGRVKIGGEEWSARPMFDGQVIEPGVRVEVGEIKGATALVFE
ncbi:MAG TPA: NfeD family protein [Thermoanaerobaculia bacterium]|jgi:membrane protein implicated in regulation of membrane protease activity|nr:NfeD family protein [Thermoanaerobaculia bacterium]